MQLHVAASGSIRLHASLDYILKGFHAAPVVFHVYALAPCISRLHLRGLHAAPVVAY